MRESSRNNEYFVAMKKIHLRNIFRGWVLRNTALAHFLSRHCLKTYLALMYEQWTGLRMDYRNPKDLNQALIKLSWLNSRNSKMRELIPYCVDKYAVREYIESHGYGDMLNDIYGVYDRVEDIDFSSLPNQFVMKMTNASGRNWICKDKTKADWPVMKERFSKWLQDTDFGWQTGEWQYSLIKPRIVIEKYLASLGEIAPIDYKFHCFHGQPTSCFVGYDRDPNDTHGRVCFDDYDLDWNRTERIVPWWHSKRRMLPKPKCFEQMVQIAKDLSKDFIYVRVDLYEIEGKILFGELTFTPQGNVQEFYTREYLQETKKYIV